MKIIPIAIGSRGDIEPFIAMAEILQNSGHEVICAFPEQFRNLTEDAKDNCIISRAINVEEMTLSATLK